MGQRGHFSTARDCPQRGIRFVARRLQYATTAARLTPRIRRTRANRKIRDKMPPDRKAGLAFFCLLVTDNGDNERYCYH